MASVLVQVVSAAALLFGMLGASDAKAWFKVCNQTSKRVTFTYTYADGNCGADPWRNEGWWPVEPNQCVKVNNFNMQNRVFYYYAHNSDNSLLWTSSSFKWGVNPAVHNFCRATDFPHCLAPYVCTPYPVRGHREQVGSTADYILTMTP
jgi:uncharacterized membrane protein